MSFGVFDDNIKYVLEIFIRKQTNEWYENNIKNRFKTHKQKQKKKTEARKKN